MGRLVAALVADGTGIDPLVAEADIRSSRLADGHLPPGRCAGAGEMR